MKPDKDTYLTPEQYKRLQPPDRVFFARAFLDGKEIYITKERADQIKRLQALIKRDQ